MKPIITTYTGKVICPLALKPEDVDIRDIAKSLSNKCRFGGHIEEFYSTAEHSFYCWELSKSLTNDPLVQMACLLHDGCESLTTIDHVKPCKANYAVALPPNGEIVTIEELERRISEVMVKGLDLPINFSDPLIKYVDKTLLNTEVQQFRGHKIFDEYPVANLTIECWEPKVACQLFLVAYEMAKGCIENGRTSS